MTQTDQLHTILLQSLQTLRKGVGLTPWRLAKQPQLKQAIARKCGLESQALSMQQAYNYVLYELRELGNSAEAQATRNAFAVDQEHNPGTLMQRRTLLATQLRRHSDTIETYENQGIKRLVTRLLDPDILPTTQAVERPRKTVATTTASSAKPPPTNSHTIARQMVTYGLSELYSLGLHASEILSVFGSGHSTYQDTTLALTLGHSSRGPDWYTYKLQGTFRTQQQRLRVGVVKTIADYNTLLASGLVDDVLKLNDTAQLAEEVAHIRDHCFVIYHDLEHSTQQLSHFGTIDLSDRLQAIWGLHSEMCQILELALPQNETMASLYEYRWVFDLRIDQPYAFWKASGLTYLNTISIDVSHFPQKQTKRFYIIPFLGVASRYPMNQTAEQLLLTVNSWVMPGQGVTISWQ